MQNWLTMQEQQGLIAILSAYMVGFLDGIHLGERFSFGTFWMVSRSLLSPA
jgi:hypothetical protein